MDYDEVYEKSGRTGSWYVTVARKIESDKADAVRAFKTEHDLRGVRLEPDTKRYYPNSSLACHLIGFVGTDNYGLEGIEARYDSVLSGTAGKTVRATNAYGTELLFNQFEEYRPGEDGYDIVTTIDSTIQYYVEEAPASGGGGLRHPEQRGGDRHGCEHGQDTRNGVARKL